MHSVLTTSPMSNSKGNNPPLPPWSWDPIQLLALGLGSGRAPVAPGTFGTLVGVLFYLPLATLPTLPYLAITVLLFGIGIPICAYAARQFGVHDHGAIVWDEIVGYLVSMAFAPPGWLWMALGFVLFRLFDIWKPWPINWLDKRVSGGLGIMVDDLLAGIVAAVVLMGLQMSGLINLPPG